MLGLRERMEENGSAPGTGEAKRSAAAPADPEVVDRPLRRRFSPSYKLRIVEEADRCTEPGEVTIQGEAYLARWVNSCGERACTRRT